MRGGGWATSEDVAGPDLIGPVYVAEDELDVLFRRHSRALLGMVWVMLGDLGVAEEVVQDAFLSLQRAWPTMRDQSRALGYLRATSLNLVRARLRHRLVVLRHPLARPLDTASAEDAVMLSEDRREVWAALRRLPERQRECLVLRYYAEMNDDDIASTLRISQNSVRTHLRRGMAALDLSVNCVPRPLLPCMQTA